MSDEHSPVFFHSHILFEVPLWSPTQTTSWETWYLRRGHCLRQRCLAFTPPSNEVYITGFSSVYLIVDSKLSSTYSTQKLFCSLGREAFSVFFVYWLLMAVRIFVLEEVVRCQIYWKILLFSLSFVTWCMSQYLWVLFNIEMQKSNVFHCDRMYLTMSMTWVMLRTWLLNILLIK